MNWERSTTREPRSIGEEGGDAVADVLFGDVTPSGKLPLTFPKSIDQLPPYEDYAMQNRIYRYMTDEPLFPFGLGLSYTQLAYENLRLSASAIEPGECLHVEVIVANAGECDAEEVVQLYVTDCEASLDGHLV